MPKRIVLSALFDFEIVSILLLVLLSSSCKKSEMPTANLVSEKFFNVKPGSPQIIKRIVTKIKLQNSKEHFLEKVIEDEGYAIWDKSEIVKYSSGIRICVPLVLENTNYVNSYILYNENNGRASMHLIRGRKYASYGFGTKDFSGTTIALDLIRLNHLVYNVSDFELKDHRLFQLNNLKDISWPLILKLIDLSASQSRSNSPVGIQSNAKEHLDLAPSSSSTNEDSNPADDDPSIDGQCGRTLTVDGCAGVIGDTGPYNCPVTRITYVAGGACELPPLGPTGGSDGGGSLPPGGSGSGGSDGSSLPGLNIAMPTCPVGMSQEQCDQQAMPINITYTSWITTELGLDEQQAQYLSTHSQDIVEIINYLTALSSVITYEEKKVIAIEHINRSMTDPNYNLFLKTYRRSSPVGVWWENSSWLSNPFNWSQHASLSYAL
jgi:hypothetical protein